MRNDGVPLQQSKIILTALAISICGVIVLSSSAFAAKSDFLVSVEICVSKNNKMTAERVELGKALFFDPRLSANNQMSCATCHNPSLYWTDGRKKAIGNVTDIA